MSTLGVSLLEIQAPAPDVVANLVEVTRETVERMTPLRAASEHPLKLLLPGNPIKILGDAEALGDALRNLIENAFAHSPPGAPVEIEVTPGGAIEVRDSGHGVPAKNRNRIFERFWRGERASGDGAGLGLSIVQAIATRHRGTVSVSDNPGGGAVFRLQFPVSNARPAPARFTTPRWCSGWCFTKAQVARSATACGALPEAILARRLLCHNSLRPRVHNSGDADTQTQQSFVIGQSPTAWRC